MDKKTIIILIALFIIASILSLPKTDDYKIIKVIDATKLYIDFNNNHIADPTELVEYYNINTNVKELNVIDKAKLNYLATKYVKENLLNKKIYYEKQENGTPKLTLETGEDYIELLKQKGYIYTKKHKNVVYKNLEIAKKLDLVAYNLISGKYHKLNCKYAIKSPNVILLQKQELPQKNEPCAYCNQIHNKKETKQTYPKDIYEKPNPYFAIDDIEFYITDFTKHYYPSNKCLSSACQVLLKEINNAKSTIDFAIYGIDGQPTITNALIQAQKRGVIIRWVYDADKYGKTIYTENEKLKQTLTNVINDTQIVATSEQPQKNIQNAIMHNKFFIFDDHKVWTGSANISHTDLSGFNANTVLLIKSPLIAKIYKQEFEQMYAGNFHKLKKSKTQNNVVQLCNTELSVYFSPQDKIITNKLIPLISNAQKYIYIPVFVITHKDFVTELINAKNRGVDVKIIVDATSANSKHSMIKTLRQNNIEVKTENRAGKMHMKSIIIDDTYLIIGSMNFTKSGEFYNDENVIIIKNKQLTQEFKKIFLELYNKIPNEWLHKNPPSESKYSINSCNDGIDNDFDQKVDLNDSSCHI